MSLWTSISKVVYKEYDRRIKRASLITEYGAAHHDDHAVAHADDAHEDEADEAEIVNVPRGTPVGGSQESGVGSQESEG